MLEIVQGPRRMDTEAPVEKIEHEPKFVTKDHVTVILPVLDEEGGVGRVIDELHQNGYKKILVVDGYSTDNTIQAARSRDVDVITQHGKGKTGAIKTAIDTISTPYIIIMEGDYTYDPADIERFLQHANGYDEIVGSRLTANIGWLHKLGNRIISMIFNVLFGSSISDVCSGMYLMNSNSAKQLNLRTRGFSVEVEVLAQMSMNGRVTEVPINYRKRIGNAKLNTWLHGFDIMKSILLLARLYNPVFLFSLITTSAAIPALAILLSVLWFWLTGRGFQIGWAVTGATLLIISSYAFAIGTIAVLLKRTEIRIEKLVRANR